MEREKHEADDEGQAFLSNDEPSRPKLEGSGKKRRMILGGLRLGAEVAMLAFIVFLLAAKPYCGRDTIRKTPVPRLPRKMYTFLPNSRYMNDDMWFNERDTLLTLHNWIELSAKARGFIVVKNPEKYDLPEPHTVAVNLYEDGPGYMMTVFHQLHCLSYIAEHYQQGYAGTNLTGEVAHHTSHCFNYLRQGIMCTADTTLEGKTKEGPGEGSEHECVDYDALLKWANDNGAMPWRGNMPDDTTL
ncbi:hypothetical protein B0I35DRAFT_476471 [Stachybotrys elegans]|uniref:Oxidase ustYa n=1 Tax=Stachybotrys elegans TaxID=80388 RepID=A0A8K0T0K3_9HYPO|nr:hypothetical protein B0I35DRAFT_476471 [Stachybotrys elegans]